MVGMAMVVAAVVIDGDAVCTNTHTPLDSHPSWEKRKVLGDGEMKIVRKKPRVLSLERLFV